MDLHVTTLVVGPFQQNCRLVVDRESGEGVVIDPGAEAERILEAVERSGARVTHVLATHAHLDHVAAAAEVTRGLDVPFALHGEDLPILRRLPEHGLVYGIAGLEAPEVDIDLASVEGISFGGEVVRVLHTPGHTPGGVTFLFGTEGFFGDTLFHLSIGRTDLGGDAQVYARTLRDVVLALPDEIVVRTGHGPDSTIAVERRQNPFLNGSFPVA